MSNSFNAYHKWLGIPPDEQPPDHYRLLGIRQFEDDADVISHAADRQMAHLRSLQAGQYRDESQRLLNEISTAKICLLDPQRRADYDAQLKTKPADPSALAKAKPLPQPRSAIADRGPAAAVPLDQIATPRPKGVPIVSTKRTISRARGRNKRNNLAVILAVAAGGVVTAGGILFALNSSKSPSGQTALNGTLPGEPAKANVDVPMVEQDRNPLDDAVSDNPIDQATQTNPTDGSNTSDVEQGSQPIATPTAEPDGADSPPPQEEEEDAAETEPVRLPVPDDEARRTALQTVRDIFKSQSEKAKTPDEQRALAEKMLQAALDTNGDPAARYVLLRVARDVAVMAGDAALVVEAVAQLGDAYEIDPLDMEGPALLKAAEAARLPDDRQSFVEVAGDVADEAAAADRFDLSLPLAEAVIAVARPTADIELIKQAVARKREIEDQAAAYEPVKAALAVLNQNPDDADANLAFGRYCCLVKGDWFSGLPHLVKSNHAELQAVARLEIGEPADVEQQVRLGDVWWDLAEGETGTEKAAMQQRAADWYRTALPSMDGGFAKTKVETRLAQLTLQSTTDAPASVHKQHQPDLNPVELLASINIKRDTVVGEWQIAGRALTSSNRGVPRLQIPYVPPPEYALEIVVSRLNGSGALGIILVSPERQFFVGLDGGSESDTAGIGAIDGRRYYNNESTRHEKVFAVGKPVKLICTVGHDRIVVAGDGHVILDWRGDPRQLSLISNYAIPNPRTLGLGTWNSSFAFHSIRLTPIAPQESAPSDDTTGSDDEEPKSANAKRFHPVLNYEMKAPPPDAVAFGGHHYKAYFGNLTWHDAQARCKEMGGYLACVENGPEREFLCGIKNGKAVWLGGYKKSTNNWRWINGAVVRRDDVHWRRPGHNFVCFTPGKSFTCRLDDGRVRGAGERVSGFICEWE